MEIPRGRAKEAEVMRILIHRCGGQTAAPFNNHLQFPLLLQVNAINGYQPFIGHVAIMFLAACMLAALRLAQPAAENNPNTLEAKNMASTMLHSPTRVYN